MKAIFFNTFSRARGQIIGWGLTMVGLGLMVTSVYDVVLENQQQILQLISNYPPEMMAFFGNVTEFATPEGFLSVEYFSFMPVILGIFAVLAGSGLLAGDEENGTLDLVLAHPVSRTAFFAGRLLAFVTTALAILALGWIGLLVPRYWTTLDVDLGRLALPFLGILAQVLLFGTLALLLSMVLPSRRMAAMGGAILLIASFFLTSLARLNEALEGLARLSPLNYYQSGDAIAGLNGEWLAGLLAASAIFAALAWWRFERRDIRVGGEGGWRLPLLRRRAVRV